MTCAKHCLTTSKSPASAWSKRPAASATSSAKRSPTPMNASSAKAAPIYALVLAGAHSKRMQRDKAALVYHGRSQLEWAVSFLQPHVERVFVSVRPDQTNDPVRSRFEQIVDTETDLGPIAGIMAAQAKYPEVAWLVLACDLP